jgi:hypothetical protein
MNEHHFLEMAIIMIIAGFLSTMNNWIYDFSHMRFSLNDIYMISLMTGWMIAIMGIWYYFPKYIFIGLSIVLLSISAIQNQWFVSYNEYLRGMIPHHSMALTMSKPHLQHQFANNIYMTQLREIDEMSKITDP